MKVKLPVESGAIIKCETPWVPRLAPGSAGVLAGKKEGVVVRLRAGRDTGPNPSRPEAGAPRKAVEAGHVRHPLATHTLLIAPPHPLSPHRAEPGHGFRSPALPPRSGSGNTSDLTVTRRGPPSDRVSQSLETRGKPRCEPAGGYAGCSGRPGWCGYPTLNPAGGRCCRRTPLAPAGGPLSTPMGGAPAVGASPTG